MDQLQSFLNSGVVQNLYVFFKVIFIFLDAALFGIFVFAVVNGWKFRPKVPSGEKEKRKTLTLQTAVFHERWQGIMKKASLGSVESMRVAVIEADTVVDDVLKSIGIPGEHMADRLTKVNPDTLQSFDRLIRVHRLRNELVHTPGFSLSVEDAKSALGDYEAFLKEIGILL